LQQREILGRDIKGNTEATSQGGLAVTKDVPRKADPRHEIVLVGFRFAESKCPWEILHGIWEYDEIGIGEAIEGLCLDTVRIAVPLIAHSKVQGETRGGLPIVLHKPVKGILVAIKNTATRSAQGTVVAGWDNIVDQLTQVSVVPLTARAR